MKLRQRLNQIYKFPNGWDHGCGSYQSNPTPCGAPKVDKMTAIRSSLSYRVVIDRLAAVDGGGFLARVPDLPGCMSDGASRGEALINVEDAIVSWIEMARELGHAIPHPADTLAQPD